MIESIIIFIGGGIGSVLRYWLSRFTNNYIGSNFPYGTLAVNILGCFIIGLFMTLFAERFLVNPRLRLLLTVGFLGGLTTFSTFSYESFMLIEEKSFYLAGVNILCSVLSCSAATWAGTLMGKSL